MGELVEGLTPSKPLGQASAYDADASDSVKEPNATKRRGRDSNSRYTEWRTTAFEAAAFNRSATPPDWMTEYSMVDRIAL
jgi:hypothetical protein